MRATIHRIARAVLVSGRISFYLCCAEAAFACGDNYDVAFSTYFGQGPTVRDVTSDAQGNIYITGGGGTTTPITPRAHQWTVHGTMDVFVAKLGPAGSLIWSTLIGGQGD